MFFKVSESFEVVTLRTTILCAVIVVSVVSLGTWERVAFLLIIPRISSIGFWILQLILTYYLVYLILKSSVLSNTGHFVGAISIGVLAIAVGYIYPIVNQGGVYSGASDRDEALEAALGALLSGQYPYSATAHVPATGTIVGVGGNPISAMPGELFLAVPFYVLGATHLQSIFWLYAAFLVVLQSTHRSEFALAFLVVLLGSPSITMAELLTGGDMLAMSLAIGISAWLMFTTDLVTWRYSAATVLGLAIASRPHFYMLLPILISAQLSNSRIKSCFPAIWSSATAISVSLGYYLASPSMFSPLHATSWISRFSEIHPHADLCIVGIFVLAQLAMTVVARGQGFRYFAFAGGIMMSIPPITFIALESVGQETITLQKYAWYAIPGWVMLSLSVITFFDRNYLPPHPTTSDFGG